VPVAGRRHRATLRAVPSPWVEWRVPLVRAARLLEHDFKPDNRAVKNDCSLFAGPGRDLNVLEGLEQSLVVGLADRAFALLGTV
jgi:hypothetical protein